jgi:hypothetical protein
VSTLVVAFVLVAVIAFLAGMIVGGTVEQFKSGGSRDLARDCNTALREAEGLRKVLYGNHPTLAKIVPIRKGDVS